MNYGTMMYINNAQTKITLIKMEINRIYVIYAMCKLFNIKYKDNIDENLISKWNIATKKKNLLFI